MYSHTQAHTGTHSNRAAARFADGHLLKCNTQQHTATHSHTLQHTATHSNTLKHTATHSNTQQHTATHSNTLQHAATHCNTLQHNKVQPCCREVQRRALVELQHTATHCKQVAARFEDGHLSPCEGVDMFKSSGKNVERYNAG